MKLSSLESGHGQLVTIIKAEAHLLSKNTFEYLILVTISYF